MSVCLPDTPPPLFSDVELKAFYDEGVSLAADGVDHERSEDLDHIRSRAHAIARDAYAEPFDPEHNAADRPRAEAYERDVKELQRAQAGVELTRATLAERELDVAERDTGLSRPQVEPIVPLTAVAAIGLTIAPTLHDQLFTTLDDELLAWSVSLTLGSVVSSFITWGMLPGETQGRSATNWMALASGVAVTVGLGAMRVAYAATWRDVTFAAALTVFEVGAVALLEAKASAVRAKNPDWLEHQAQLHRARAAAASARDAYARAEQGYDAIQTRIATHVNFCELRSRRHSKVGDMDELAHSTLLQGYRDQVADNRRRRIGGASMPRRMS